MFLRTRQRRSEQAEAPTWNSISWANCSCMYAHHSSNFNPTIQSHQRDKERVGGRGEKDLSKQTARGAKNRNVAEAT